MLIACTGCQSQIRVPEAAAGKKGKCPKCGTVITIPAVEPAPPAEPAPPPPPPVPVQVAAAPLPAPSNPPPIPKPRRREDEADDRPSRRRDDDEEDDRPPRRRDPDDEQDDDRPRQGESLPSIRRPRQERGMSIASMVLGISGLAVLLLSGGATLFGAALLTCMCPLGCIAGPAGYAGITLSAVLAVIAVPLGFFGMSRGGRGMAIAGIATGIGTLVLCAILLMLTLIFGVGVMVAGANAPRQPAPPPFRPRRF